MTSRDVLLLLSFAFIFYFLVLVSIWFTRLPASCLLILCMLVYLLAAVTESERITQLNLRHRPALELIGIVLSRRWAPCTAASIRGSAAGPATAGTTKRWRFSATERAMSSPPVLAVETGSSMAMSSPRFPAG